MSSHDERPVSVEPASTNDVPSHGASTHHASSDTETTAVSATRWMRIIAGLHVGASRALTDQEMLLVGSGEDCDIVLSDPGVAPHHALVTVIAGAVSVRALDAPLRIGGHALHPGDPIELATLQRIELGSATLVIGMQDDPAWNALLPSSPTVNAGFAPRPVSRRLPAIAALAALSLASVAIFAAVVPHADPGPAPQEQLTGLIAQYGISEGRVSKNADGALVLSGTVKDTATRDRIQQQLRNHKLDAALELRTGEDVAADVGEVLRAQGIAVQPRSLGNGDVEIDAERTDRLRLEAVLASRAMREIPGIRKVVTRNLAPATPALAAAKSAPKPKMDPTTITAVVKGKNPHVVTVDGTRYEVGEQLPDGRTLIAIGSKAWVQSGEGYEQLKPKPSAARKTFANVQTQTSPPSSNTFANVQTRPPEQRM